MHDSSGWSMAIVVLVASIAIIFIITNNFIKPNIVLSRLAHLAV